MAFTVYAHKPPPGHYKSKDGNKYKSDPEGFWIWCNGCGSWHASANWDVAELERTDD